jgi:hypothetical protein
VRHGRVHRGPLALAKGEVVLEAAFGQRSIEQGLPATPSTLKTKVF